MKILPVRPLYYLTNLEVLAGRILAMSSARLGIDARKSLGLPRIAP